MRNRAGVTLLVAAMACMLTPTYAQTEVPWAVRIQPEVRPRPIQIDRGAAALEQTLKKLQSRASVLMIDAHPDDEDGSLLAYESRGRGARVALLTLNRGEGGQNAMGPDLSDALGLVRTEELLAADDYYGAQQYFTSAVDFGFSKSRRNTLKAWGHKQILGEVVRTIRTVRPLVIVSVFVGGPTDGHGNHQAAGELAQEAFAAAGDPKMFPDQIREGLEPWQPLKDYARVPRHTNVDSANSLSDMGAVGFGKIFDYANSRTYPLRFFNYVTQRWHDGALSADLTVPEGTYDSWLGGTFVQIGRQGLGEQKSQTGGVTPPPPGPEDVSYHLVASRVREAPSDKSMFSGIDTSLAGIATIASAHDTGFLRAGLRTVQKYVDGAAAAFDPRNLDHCAPELAAGAEATDHLIAAVQSSVLGAAAKASILHELQVKKAQFNTALQESLGLAVRASVVNANPTAMEQMFGPSTSRVITGGETVKIEVRASNMGSQKVAVQRVWLQTPENEHWGVSEDAAAPAALNGNSVASVDFQTTAPIDAKPTAPYFSRENQEQLTYSIHDAKYLGRPLAPYPVTGWVEFAYKGATIQAGQVVQTFQREVGYGSVGVPLVVVPPVSAWIPLRRSVVRTSATSFPLGVVVHADVNGGASGKLVLRLPTGWTSRPAVGSFSVPKAGQSETVNFEINPTEVEDRSYEIQAVATYKGHEYQNGYETVGYTGLRPYYLYRRAAFTTTGANLEIPPQLKVGFVVGTGSSVVQALGGVGINATIISATDIASADLTKFDAIVIGVRAYSVRPELRTYNQRLLDYVHDGGTLIVQYQAGDYNHGYAPYPLTVGIGPYATVTNEKSDVRILAPEDRAFTWPNHITEKDFAGWIEERGHGFATSWGQQWTPLVEMHDDGQSPQRGGLLVSKYGRGHYVYDSVALYRQLPQGVPGAYRILVNLLSLDRSPQKSPKK